MAKRAKLKRYSKQKAKRMKKIKLGKPVPFNRQNSPKKYRGFYDKYFYKANIHNIIYKGATFSNVRFQASNLTNCNFRGASLKGVDFCNCNLKGNDFRNSNLEGTIFFNCNLKKCSFDNAKLNNVTFIATNTKVAKDLHIGAGCRELKSYPKVKLDATLSENIYNLTKFEDLLKPCTIHVTENKINLWMIELLLANTSQEDLSRCFYALAKRRNKKNFYTIYSYQKFIDSYLQR